MTPRTKIIIALPLVALLVVALAYFQLFTSPEVIGLIVVLYVAVSLWNRRKFSKGSKGKETKKTAAAPVPREERAYRRGR